MTEELEQRYYVKYCKGLEIPKLFGKFNRLSATIPCALCTLWSMHHSRLKEERALVVREHALVGSQQAEIRGY